MLGNRAKHQLGAAAILHCAGMRRSGRACKPRNRRDAGNFQRNGRLMHISIYGYTFSN
jgi:hypothetical protein